MQKPHIWQICQALLRLKMMPKLLMHLIFDFNFKDRWPHQHKLTWDTLLETLHWLPVKKRAEYKAACLVYKCLAGEGPAYLSDRLKIYTPARALRSSRDKTKLVEKVTRTKLGERSFSSFGPKIWNRLPGGLRECGTLVSFKKKLKTHLFVCFI